MKKLGKFFTVIFAALGLVSMSSCSKTVDCSCRTPDMPTDVSYIITIKDGKCADITNFAGISKYRYDEAKNIDADGGYVYVMGDMTCE